MSTIKGAMKAILPRPLTTAIRRYRLNGAFSAFRNLPTQEVFSKVYETGIWGSSDDLSQPFFSGTGSHDAAVVSAYVSCVEGFLKGLERKPNVVDLGCGDFSVGSKIRPLCGRYIACDVVPSLIDFNRRKFNDLDVEFAVLNMTTDKLPEGEIVFIRQVLQHLSNDEIKKILSKVSARYKYLVLTEHWPGTAAFTPNLDKPAGPDIRTTLESGVVITSPPFSFKAKQERQLAKVPVVGNELIVTTLYALQ